MENKCYDVMRCINFWSRSWTDNASQALCKVSSSTS